MATHYVRRRGVPVFDVRARTLNFGPRNTIQLEPNGNFAVYVEAAGRLYLMDDVSFEVLDPPPPCFPHEYLADGGRKPLKNWKWRHLPDPPFFGKRYTRIAAHAVHPDGQTLFFSMSKCGGKCATFSFDTESSTWASHGAWQLPFGGRGYFDPDIDAWVGLPDRRYPSRDALGHLCASQVVTPPATGQCYR